VPLRHAKLKRKHLEDMCTPNPHCQKEWNSSMYWCTDLHRYDWSAGSKSLTFQVTLLCALS